MMKLPEEDPIPINELSRALGKHVATAYRWGSPRGVRGCRLRLTRIGGRTYVSHADWEAFTRALNSEEQPPQEQTPAKQEADALVDGELDAAGL